MYKESWVVDLRYIKKIVPMEEAEPIKKTPVPSPDDLDFWLWKAEFNKELMDFWKSLDDDEG